ncbi:palmitoyltransferase ZDHHC12 isoform X1 [Ranitomeya imitator]|uniref:palmitoyltransferase ZDHHC12 isoform X1 n=2 Tax=Ranitomeya imitator TaxID=111125 RepID=UPI001AA45A2F
MFHTVWGSGCGVRTVHTLLTCGVTLLLLLHHPDLSPQENAWIHLPTLMFVLMVTCSTALYYGVSLMDPGYVLSDCNEKYPLSAANDKQEMTSLSQGALRMRRCGYCLLKQPMRARHCKSCQRCVRRYDHHCPWIENCVGEKNHRVFIFYLVLQLLVLLWAVRIAWSGLHPAGTWGEWLRANIFLLAAFGVIAVFTVVVSLLLVSHMYLISCNVTTWEFMSHHRIAYLKQCDSDTNPFDRGLIRNVWSFFCTCGNVVWERLYFRDAITTV